MTERLAQRLVLDLFDVDRRGLRRHNLLDMMADLPLRDADGEYLPTASWERVSREAGVTRDDDWDRRLGSISGSDRGGAAADSLRAFVLATWFGRDEAVDRRTVHEETPT